MTETELLVAWFGAHGLFIAVCVVRRIFWKVTGV